MPKICLRYARDMPKICTRYARNMPEICPRYAQDMPKICPRHAQDMPKTCPRHTQDISKKCPRYARDMTGARARFGGAPFSMVGQLVTLTTAQRVAPWAGKFSAVSGSGKLFDKGCYIREPATSCDFYFDPLVSPQG